MNIFRRDLLIASLASALGAAEVRPSYWPFVPLGRLWAEDPFGQNSFFLLPGADPRLGIKTSLLSPDGLTLLGLSAMNERLFWVDLRMRDIAPIRLTGMPSGQWDFFDNFTLSHTQLRDQIGAVMSNEQGKHRVVLHRTSDTDLFTPRSCEPFPNLDRVQFSADGAKVLTVWDRGTRCRIESQTDRRVRLELSQGNGFVLSPDGRYLTQYDGKLLWIHNLDVPGKEPVGEVSMMFRDPVWCPDSRFLLLTEEPRSFLGVAAAPRTLVILDTVTKSRLPIRTIYSPAGRYGWASMAVIPTAKG